jgi:predicted ferric reductase
MKEAKATGKTKRAKLAKLAHRPGIGERYNADWAAIVLGVGLGLTVALEIESMSNSDWSGVYPTITSISRLAALIGSYFALVGLVLVSRIPWIERSVGHDRLVRWHRKLGPWSLYLIFFHVLLVALGYAGGDRVSMAVELWRMTIKYPWMIEADIAFVFMIAAGVTSYKKARAKMSYETWWTVHALTYAAIALGFMHQVLTGPMFIGHPLNKYYWEGLYIASGAVIVLWRMLIPAMRSLRHSLKVDHVTIEGPGIVSVVMRGRNVERLRAQGGQFFSWRFAQRGHWLVAHPYSLSAAPQKDYLRITVKDLGDHSGDLLNLKAGTRVFFEGPYGTFVASRASRGHIVLIGGGVGITPLRALLDEVDPTKQVDLLYRVSSESDLIFRKELDAVAAYRGARVHYLVGSRKEHPMSADYISQYVPAFADAEVYVCGPTPLVEQVFQSAKDAGIPRDKIHAEEFEFHAI